MRAAWAPEIHARCKLRLASMSRGAGGAPLRQLVRDGNSQVQELGQAANAGVGMLAIGENQVEIRAALAAGKPLAKVGSVSTSSNVRHRGQGTTIISFHLTLMHH